MKEEFIETSSFYALMFRQKYIKRWGLMRNTHHESLSEHSAECAMLTHALAMIGNTMFGKSYNVDRAVTLALYHDVPEVFTGDMPTPVKYANPAIRSQFAEIEKQAVEALVSKLPSELRDQYRSLLEGNDQADAELHALVKTADKLCAYIKCIEEGKAGNTEFSKAGEEIRTQLDKNPLPELKYFTEHFLPAFLMTLDEQQEN